MNPRELHSEARQPLVDIFPEASYHLETFDAHVEAHGPSSFAVLKIGGGIIEDADHFEGLVKSISDLYTLGYTPVVVHGGGAQINETLTANDIRTEVVDGLRVTPKEAIPHIVESMDAVNLKLVDALQQRGVGAVGLKDVIFADYKDQAKYQEVGEVTDVHLPAIFEAVENRQVPIISCLGKLAVDTLIDVNINGDDAAAAIVERIKPLKYLSVTPTGGVLDKTGELISTITQEDLIQLVEDEAVDGGMAKKLEAGMQLVDQDLVRDVVIVSPEHITRELFTHEGFGTLLTATAPLEVYEGGMNGFDAQKLKALIESAFAGKSLVDGYFEDTDIAKIVLTRQKYDGVGIFTNPDSGLLRSAGAIYMDKLAVAPHAQGHNLAKQIFNKAANEHPIFWRADVNNPYHAKYAEMADSYVGEVSETGKHWTVFWKGVSDHGVIAEMISYAKNQPVTIA